ncbi:hypothetical protein ZIOFF_031233 [Zingiber officinale]|uniref:Uncharacterized protein n=1 Tax=Zingiber officinale TaxID=94328 RepID=A0A8J5GLV5_ZINOF|nr:hypothetical protein ZIOFF_031233 [Zingiber officinale]
MELSAKWRKKHRLEGDGVDVEDDSEPIDYQGLLNKRRWLDLLRWSMIDRIAFGGVFSLDLSSDILPSWSTQPYSKLGSHGNCVIMLILWMKCKAGWSYLQVFFLFLFFFFFNLDNGLDLVAVLACSFAVKGIIDSSRSLQHWMWYSCYVGMLLAIFWLFYMLKLPKFRWDVLWLPLGPLSGAGACLYVDRLLHGSLKDVKLLRSYMYNYKAL